MKFSIDTDWKFYMSIIYSHIIIIFNTDEEYNNQNIFYKLIHYEIYRFKKISVEMM